MKILESDGWYQVCQKGSHRQFKHVSEKGNRIREVIC
ncbi:MAG: type II toxin-antitoxin system HicA family toxin [Cyclobacteriaceae bacterium]